MSKDIDLTEILKNCPRGAKFYSYIFGEDTHFMGVSPHQGDARPIFIYGKYGEGQNFCLTRKGHAYADNYGECCIFPSKEQRDWSKFSAPWYKNEELIKPKFKAGDIIRHKGPDIGDDDLYEISKVYNNHYGLFGSTRPLYMKYQDVYELVPNKFDPHTLKPFDKVIARIDSEDSWNIDFFSCFRLNELPFCLGGIKCAVLPYNDDTKHLIGTTKEAPDFYKYWED